MEHTQVRWTFNSTIQNVNSQVLWTSMILVSLLILSVEIRATVNRQSGHGIYISTTTGQHEQLWGQTEKSVTLVNKVILIKYFNLNYIHLEHYC